MLDRYLLRYFLAVVDQGNFSRAASHCNVSQPTLSVGIAKLERELGASLFLRSNQRVQLTAAGSVFLTHARRIEIEFNNAHRAMSLTDTTPLLRIGILLSIPSDRIGRAVRAAARLDHAAPIEIVYGTERELIGYLARGRIDVALTLVGRGSGRFLEIPLSSETYGLALSFDHPLAQRKQIAAEELADNAMIVRRHCEALAETSRHFTERGIRPRFSLRSTNDDQVLQMVAAGLGVTVMPMSFEHPGVARPRLSGFEMERTIGFALGHEAEHLGTDMPALMVAIVSEIQGADGG